LQDVQEATIDEVIGGNLTLLRAGMTLAETADTLSALTGQSFSEAKLSRWENGKYRFTVHDLHLLSQVYGVNLLGLLKPSDGTTHIQVGNSLYPIDVYMYDFFIDPRGSLTERATVIAERNKEGTRDVIDALNDVADHLGEKGQLADFHAGLQRFRATARKVIDDDRTMKRVTRKLIDGDQAMKRTARQMRDAAQAMQELQGDDDGIDQEDQ